jgi:hypothetical protein
VGLVDRWNRLPDETKQAATQDFRKKIEKIAHNHSHEIKYYNIS